jgi:hypothetical protein
MVYNIFFTNKELFAEYNIINLNQGVYLKYITLLSANLWNKKYIKLSNFRSILSISI